MAVVIHVDDDALQGRLIVDNLRGIGHIVLWMSTGWDGLIEAHRVRPDLMLVDVDVPQSTDILTLVRTMRSLWRLPLLVIADYQPSSYYRRKYAVTGVLVKPFDADVLVEQVRCALQAGASARHELRPAAASLTRPPLWPLSDLAGAGPISKANAAGHLRSEKRR